MPYRRIKGDVPQNVIRLPRAGKIRLGIKIKSAKGTEYPKETSYFVVPKEIQAKFGPEPTRLPVMLAVEDDEQNFRQYYACWGSNQRLKCQGDGETAERRNEKGVIEKIDCPRPPDCDYAKKNGCRSRMDLMVVLPDISVGAAYQVSTGSINADIDVRSGIAMARSLYGRASWVPLDLVREPMKMLEPGTNKMQTHYPVKLIPYGDIEAVMAVRKDTKLIPTEKTTRYLLPDPVIEGEPDTPVEYTDEENALLGKQEQPPSRDETEGPLDTPAKQESNAKMDFLTALKDCNTLGDVEILWQSYSTKFNGMTVPEWNEFKTAKDKRLKELKDKK